MSELDDIFESDRRSAPRAGITAQVHIQGSAQWAGTYETGDLSSSGAFLVSDTPPPRGSMVRLDLVVGDAATVRDIDALVVHVRAEASEASARGCGVMFLRLDREAVETLSSLVAGRLDELP